MTAFHRAILLAVLQCGIVLSLGAKLLWDRAYRPRVWARALAYDPSTPLRGRYVRLQLVVQRTEPVPADGDQYALCRLMEQNGQLAAVPDPDHGTVHVTSVIRPPVGSPSVISEPIAFFLPEHVPDPSLRREDEELWAEVTIPRQGPPRPIRLAVRRAGTVTPLPLR